jgi:glycerol-3-phosphate dehydrogenase (NAD(P)+)
MGEGFRRIGVVGGGAFGTALAIAAGRAGRAVTLWMRDGAAAGAMAASRANPRIPGCILPADITVTADDAALAEADAVVVAVPTQALRHALQRLAPVLGDARPLILAAKGIERSTGLFVSEIVEAVLPGCPAAVLSGPGFAPDIAHGAPTALTLASADAALASALAEALGSSTLRLYHAGDVRGVEIGGAAKNVLAIACGVAAGKGFGESTVAALIARAFAELSRFGLALGARGETLAGLSGLGDLILTGTSPQSRNRRLGEALGRGAGLDAAIAQAGLAEGVWTAAILAQMARARGIDMPVAAAVADLVEGGATVDALIERLLARPRRAET